MKAFWDLYLRYWWIVAIMLLAVVTVGSLWPEMIAPEVVPSDKVRHLAAYMLVALPIAVARPRGWGWMIAGLLFWSIGIELTQPYVGRTRDIQDFLANATGVGIALIVSEAARRLRRARPA